MSKVESATQWMINLANDDSHGYDQRYRWGERGDYDCSSAVVSAWEYAGVPVKSNGASNTSNMYNVFIGCGFKDVTGSINLSNGSGLQRGDVLLNTGSHTAMYIGNGQEVEASINEHGGITGGTPGDQTGKEIHISAYRNHPWNKVLRYEEYGLGEVIFQKQMETLDIGFSFRLPTTEGRFKYLLYDVSKDQWSTLNEWTASNWISLGLNKGSYWVQCQLYDLQSNLIDTKTIGTDAGTNTVLTGTYAGWQGSDILIGCTTNNPNADLIMKVYNVKTGKWFTQFNGQWATFTPEANTNYIIQFEVHSKDGRLLDSKAAGI